MTLAAPARALRGPAQGIFRRAFAGAAEAAEERAPLFHRSVPVRLRRGGKRDTRAIRKAEGWYVVPRSAASSVPLASDWSIGCRAFCKGEGRFQTC